MEDESQGALASASPYLFPEFAPPPAAAVPKRLRIDPIKLGKVGISALQDQRHDIEILPQPVLPTRWEYLQPKIEHSNIPLTTIINPIDQAMEVIRAIIESLRTTGGCQVFVIRADTGSGKTTFLNTLPHYMHDVDFAIQTIDIQELGQEEFGPVLRSIQVSQEKINLVILEGREAPKDISDRYVQVVLANINRFARNKRVPLLIVIPTVDEQVARNWCDQALKIGDLIPEQQLHEGSRWYNFPGVPKEQYIEIASKTVRALNPPYDIVQFGISSDEMSTWVDTSSTIGRFIEVLANKISARRRAASRLVPKIRREHVWVVYCTPDLRHYDHTYLVIDGLVQDNKMRLSPTKLVPSNADTSFFKSWRQSPQWARLVATINFLDVRLMNFPIISAVTAALVYGDEQLLQSFKKAHLRDYRDAIPAAMQVGISEETWGQQLAARKLQPQNARDSLARSNLFLLLRGMPAEEQKGGNLESVNVLAQYLHLRDHASESDIHFYIGCALQDLLESHQFPGLLGVETEQVFVPGQSDPVPDIMIHTESEVYALEFHFLRKQVASSEIQRYALKNVIDKYMKGVPHLRSLLETIE